MNPLIPVTIVTGFLGSGKTTLLRSLIKSRQSRRLALLINEFGEVSIDGALIRDSVQGSDHVRIHDFPYGLIAYGDDELFIPTMREIAARRAHIDHVLIETSGLALPSAVMELLQGPELSSDFILDATLAVVDTPLFLSNQFEHIGDDSQPRTVVANSVATLFEQQLEYADVVVLNKIDELDEQALLCAEEGVRRRAPNVRFFELAHHAQLDIRLALGLRLHQPTLASHAHSYTPVARMPGTDTPLLANQSLLNGHAHSGLGAHVHGLATHKHFHEHDPGWMSFTLRSDAPQQAEKLKAALTEAAKVEPVLRSKGFVRAIDAEHPVLMQGVRSRIIVSIDHGKPAVKRSELVFIGYHMSRTKVAALLTELTGTQWK